MNAHGLKLGLARRFSESGDHRQAEVLCRDVLAVCPDHAEAHAQLAALDMRRGALADAYTHAERARALDPGNIDARNMFGRLLQERRVMDGAEAEFRAVLAIVPDNLDALINLAGLLNACGRFADALDIADRAVAQAPEAVSALVARAAAARYAGCRTDALRGFEQACAQDPKRIDALIGLADSLVESGDIDGGRRTIDHALAVRPDDPELLTLRGMVRLLTGDFAGFADYQARWDIGKAEMLTTRYPGQRWQGESLDEKSIYLWGDQGIGEELMFGTMIPEVAAVAARCAVECAPRLVPLYQRSFANVEVVARPATEGRRIDTAAWDFRAPLRGLARWLRPDRQAFAPARAVLLADPARRAAIRGQYDALSSAPKIGIAWRSTSVNVGFSAAKSSSLADWWPILDGTDARFVNLQYGDSADERRAAAAAGGAEIHDDAAIDQGRDLDGFAAQIAALDLIITTSNTTAHMAGALGCAVWVLLPFVPDWRWQAADAESLWYPNVRLFRQPAPGDWPGLCDQVGNALRHWLTAGAAGT